MGKSGKYTPNRLAVKVSIRQDGGVGRWASGGWGGGWGWSGKYKPNRFGVVCDVMIPPPPPRPSSHM